MRIAVVTSSYPSQADDASGHFVRAEVRELIEAGHEVTLFVPRAASPSRRSRATFEPGASLCELPHFSLFGWPGSLARLRAHPWRIAGLVVFAQVARRKLRALGPFDRIVAQWIVPGFWPICRDFVESTHVVAHGSDVRLLERLPSFLRRRILDALTRDTVSLRCVSRELADRVIRLAHSHGKAAPAIEIRPASIQIPPLPSKRALREALGLPDVTTVVIVGRAVPSKRIDVAIEAVRAASSFLQCRNGARVDAASARHTGHPAMPIGATQALLPSLVRCTDRSAATEALHDDAGAGQARDASAQQNLGEVRIYVVGDGPARAAWMKRYPDVTWLGRLGRSDALRYVRASDLFVSASRLEGSPTAIREARALGTEVIAAAAGDLTAEAASDPGLHVVTDFSAASDGQAVQILTQLLERAATSIHSPPAQPLPE